MNTSVTKSPGENSRKKQTEATKNVGKEGGRIEGGEKRRDKEVVRERIFVRVGTQW